MNARQRRILAIIRKDIKEIFVNRQVWMPMLVVPTVLTIILPAILFYGAEYNMSDMKMILQYMPNFAFIKTEAQKYIFAIINYLFPPLFLIIPIMTSSVIGASSFVGEKERKTLETILYTPITISELLLAKILAIFIPSFVITIISFLTFGISVDIGAWSYFQTWIFPNAKWLVIVFWLCPAVSFFGIGAMVLISAKAKTTQGAHQMSGLVVMPFVVLLLSQVTGVIMLEIPAILLIGLALYTVDGILLKLSAKMFTTEKLLD
jgi:ABC-type Na+ efflux pump permease subunit